MLIIIWPETSYSVITSTEVCSRHDQPVALFFSVNLVLELTFKYKDHYFINQIFCQMKILKCILKLFYLVYFHLWNTEYSFNNFKYKLTSHCNISIIPFRLSELLMSLKTAKQLNVISMISGKLLEMCSTAWHMWWEYHLQSGLDFLKVCLYQLSDIPLAWTNKSDIILRIYVAVFVNQKQHFL